MLAHILEGSELGLISEVKLYSDVFFASLIALLNLAFAFLNSKMFLVFMFRFRSLNLLFFVFFSNVSS